MSELFAGPGPLASRIALHLIALLVALTVHELGHAIVADRLGDSTARLRGRLSVNPLRHLDPLGALAFLVAGYGWSRAVPVNAYALRNGRGGAALVASAGPAANLIVGVILAIGAHLARGLGALGLEIPEGVALLDVVSRFNLRLALLSVVPIPPLDAGHFLPYLLPRLAGSPVLRLETYGSFTLFVLAVGGALRLVFDPAVALVDRVLGTAVGGVL